MIIGPRIAKYNRNGTPNACPDTDLLVVLTDASFWQFAGSFHREARWRIRQRRSPIGRLREYNAGRLYARWRDPLYVDSLWKAGCFDDRQRCWPELVAITPRRS